MKPFFVVMAPSWRASSGGIRALHELRRALSTLGEDAYIAALDGENPLTLEMLSGLIDAGRKMVGIYPEVFSGNPLKADIVVRWLLNTPKNGQGQTYLPSDIKCHWLPQFSMDDSESLQVPIIDKSIFHAGEGARTLTLVYALKLRANGFEPRCEGIDITPGFGPVAQGDQETLADLFRRAKVLFCYEESSVVIEAALCGCPTLYVKSEYLPEIIDEGMFGERFNAAEIEHAQTLIQSVIDRYHARCQESPAQVRRMIERAYQQLELQPCE